MSQRIIGSNTLVQGALPTILSNTPKSFFDDTINVIQNNAKLAFTKLRGIPGLMPVMPQGAMYMMVRIDRTRFPGFKSDLQFVERLVAEQSVFCLPGKCFNYPNYVRIVLRVPSALLQEATITKATTTTMTIIIKDSKQNKYISSNRHPRTQSLNKRLFIPPKKKT